MTSPSSNPDLETIRENGSHREQSESPEPADANFPGRGFVSRVPDRRSTHPPVALSSPRKSSTGDFKSRNGSYRVFPKSTFNVQKPFTKRSSIRISIDSEMGRRDFQRRSTVATAGSTALSTACSAPFEETVVWDRKAILSLDGGGIRGYSALLILRALMRAIGDLERTYPGDPAQSSFHPLSAAPCVIATDATDAESLNSKIIVPEVTETSPWLPCHYFDYAAGTSTGGLISIMLGRLRMSIDDCIHDYEYFGDKIFGHSRWFHVRTWHFFWPRDKYKAENLEKVVQEVVDRRVPYVASFPGGRNFSSDENRCRTVVLSYQKQRTKGVEKTYLFRTYKNLHRSADATERLLDRNPGLAHDVPIYQVARATSAAPTYFKPPKIGDLEYLDGGFGANNPCIEIYDEVRKMNNNSESCIQIIVSIGTGQNKMARFGPQGVTRYWNYLNFAKKWASESESTHVDMMKKLTHSTFKFYYFRLNVEEGLAAMKLDEWKARSAMRIKLGRCIGRLRSFKPSPLAAADDQARLSHESDLRERENRNARPNGSDLRIPAWFQPKNRTLEEITRCTEKYLARPEVQKRIRECAEILVRSRRARAEQDPQRWEKTCFGAWYQCNVEKCPRAEKEYANRDALKRHLVSKHGFVDSAAGRERLHTVLDECKIMVR